MMVLLLLVVYLLHKVWMVKTTHAIVHYQQDIQDKIGHLWLRIHLDSIMVTTILSCAACQPDHAVIKLYGKLSYSDNDSIRVHSSAKRLFAREYASFLL